jgi:lipoprotein-anchoring transpeptidase ErfK/SrfK
MRHMFAFPLLILASLPFAAARAQAQYSHPPASPTPDYGYGGPAGAPPPAWRPVEPNQGANLGGGLIELLATGFAPGAAPQPAYGPASSYGRPSIRYGAPAGAASEPGSRMAYAVPPAQPNAYQRPVLSEPEPQFRRQEVEYHGPQRPGTIVIDTPHKFLYLIEPQGHALRYGIGVGRPGFEWAGMKTVTRKAEWPGWTPPSEMLKRRPDLPSHMDGGPENPLGARAMYLGSSLYRIHGTNEPETIGKAVSSGCIRMLNDDVVDLYGRVKVGTPVLVM